MTMSGTQNFFLGRVMDAVPHSTGSQLKNSISHVCVTAAELGI